MARDMSKDLAPVLARMLTTLEQKVNPKHTALVVVDMQNDYCASGGVFDKTGLNVRLMQGMAPVLSRFIEEARAAGLLIIFIRTVHISGHTYYASDVWLEHWNRTGKAAHLKYPLCEEDSWGADFHEGIKPLPGDFVVRKHRYSAFIDTDLELILRSKGIRTTIIGGVATDVCVEMTAKDGFMKDYYIVVVRDGTAAISEELHNNALRSIASHYGEVVDSGDILSCWGRLQSGKNV